MLQFFIRNVDIKGKVGVAFSPLFKSIFFIFIHSRLQPNPMLVGRLIVALSSHFSFSLVG